MKTAERIILVALLLFLIFGSAWIYFAVKHEQKEVREAVARGEYEIPTQTEEKVSPEDWRTLYPYTVPIMIGSVTVQASVADTLSTRIKGLSGTPFLPEHVVKLFAFGAEGSHSIWMKDMSYPLDIIWVAKDGEIVHIEEGVAPDTYPESFASPTLAWYVIEANAGFVSSSSVSIGDQVILPTQ